MLQPLQRSLAVTAPSLKHAQGRRRFIHDPVFTRHNPYQRARYLGRLMGLYLNDRKVSKLDEDQRQTLEIRYHGQPENMLVLSESGVYALLVYYYAPGHRLLREWQTHQVVPTLRDGHQSSFNDRSMLSLLDWPEMSLSLLHWQNEGWILLRDMPYILLNRTRRRLPPNKTYLQKLTDFFRFSRHSSD